MNKRTVVITGGSAGIGKEVARAFSEKGYNVAVCGRNNAKLNAVKAEFEFQGLKLFTVSCDVTEEGAFDFFAQKVADEFGGIDVWVNNAAITISRKPFYEYTSEEFDRLVNSNMKSVFMGAAAASRYMRERGGVIINTSSFTGVIPTCGAALYGAIKAAVDSFTKTMAGELAPFGIRVVAVSPAYVLTEMAAENIGTDREFMLRGIPMRRLAEIEDVSGVYTFLASKEAGYINGVSIPVTGGKMSVQNPMWNWDRLEK